MLKLFNAGMDTMQIAEMRRVSEAHVYRRIHTERDMERGKTPVFSRYVGRAELRHRLQQEIEAGIVKPELLNR